MKKYFKSLSEKNITVFFCLFGFFFAYLSSVSVFQFDGITESGSTSISASLSNLNVIKNVESSTSSNLLDITTSKVSVKVNGKTYYYPNLKSAVEAAPDSDEYVITLLDNLELDSAIDVPANKNIIIDGDSKYSLIRSQGSFSTWYIGRLIYVDKTANLTLRNITIDLNNNWTFDEAGYNDALTKQESIAVDSFIKSVKDEPVANGWVIYNNGNLVIDNAIIKNHYSKIYGLIYSARNSQVILSETEISHCATTQGGLVAHVVGNGAQLIIEDGTVITNNFTGGNGGLIKISSGAKTVMNGGEITNNKSVNSDGFISMMYGQDSSFIMNGGSISENSGIAGFDNKYNGAFYLHAGGYFEMNDGLIENNTGFRRGVIDVSKSTASIKLNGGTIRNNNTHTGYENYTGMYLSYDYDLTIGKKMTISDNIYVTDYLNNNGIINGDVIINIKDNYSNILTGTGKIKGDLIVKYSTNKKPTLSTKMVNGDIVFYNDVSQVLITFEYNGGVDLDGSSRTLMAIDLACIPTAPMPTKPGHTLTWYSDINLSTKWEPTETMENITLYAGWTINTYTVTWDINGSLITRKFNYDEIIKMPENPSKTGYEFDGWSNYQEGMRMPDKDITFVAKWKKS